MYKTSSCLSLVFGLVLLACGEGAVDGDPDDVPSDIADAVGSDTGPGDAEDIDADADGDADVVDSFDGADVLEDGDVSDADGSGAEEVDVGARCGDGIRDEGEECDDGNIDDSDLCLTDCTLSTCGDGFVNRAFQEESFLAPVVTDPGGVTAYVCDDGAACVVGGSPRTCDVSEIPTAPEHGICQSLGFEKATWVTWGGGPGATSAVVLHAYNWECVGFRCSRSGFPSYSPDCSAAEMLVSISCEGIVGEQCDEGDANVDAPDVCRLDCTLPRCGDAIIDTGEACDDGAALNRNEADRCRTDCSLPQCGDGVRDTGEECDHGPNNGSAPNACRETCELPACGDGVVDAGEECDDGNAVPDDGCSNNCRLPGCGDGVRQPELDEECDDGNAVNDDACTTLCLVPFCGDGFVQAPEACDDGNDSDTDACLTDCRRAECGDGVVREGVEDCDAGTANADEPNAECRTDCDLPVCGDGVVDDALGEECDDGNRVAGDGCSNLCRFPGCGDGVVQFPEECDDGNDVNTDGCRNDCIVQFCGDGVLGDNEDCDDGDGNADEPNASCRLDCTFPRCGDGVVDLGETCDDANSSNLDMCTAACDVARCGDGYRQRVAGEECDDGNNDDGDGCDSVCIREEGAAVGHAVFIGHDFFNTNEGIVNVLQNAVFALSSSSGGVRVLAFDQYVSGFSLVREVANANGALEAAAAEQGVELQIDRLSDFTTLEERVFEYDVLLLYEQSLSSAMMPTVGTAWVETLSAFLSSGGVVVGLDYNASMWRLFANGGLIPFTAGGSSLIYGTLTVSAPEHPLADGLGATYTALSGTGYVVLPTEFPAEIVVRDSTGRAIVVHYEWD
jgi:cysteine-rich repeat protein